MPKTVIPDTINIYERMVSLRLSPLLLLPFALFREAMLPYFPQKSNKVKVDKVKVDKLISFKLISL